jgi:hypothetical protein
VTKSFIHDHKEERGKGIPLMDTFGGGEGFRRDYID